MPLNRERALPAYLRALWGGEVRILPSPTGGGSAPFISDLGIHLPAVPADRQRLFAAAAHAGAHLAHRRPSLATAGRAGVSRALIGLLEDARAESLALRAYPGLLRLWVPFHTATPEIGIGFTGLLARLARTLIDATYVDDHAWIAKGRRLFDEAGGADADPDAFIRIASLLGNDIGQLRLQFNQREYVVQPEYRDDNRWLWLPDAESEGEAEPLSCPAHADPGPLPEEMSASPYRYPEWDRLIRRLRPAWCTVRDRPAEGAGAAAISPARAPLHPPHRQRRTRHRDGHAFDTDSLVDAAVSRRAQLPIDGRIHLAEERIRQPLAVLLLLDASASTARPLAGSDRSILDAARSLAACIASSCTAAGIPCAIHAFRSAGRHAVEYARIADPPAAWDDAAAGRLAGLGSGGSTRLGAALRHATALVRSVRGERLIILLTDGDAHDADIHDPLYLVADARHAVDAARRAGIRIGAVGPAPDCAPALRRILGPTGWTVARTGEADGRTAARLFARCG